MDRDARQAAEARIAKQFRPITWQTTLATVVAAIEDHDDAETFTPANSEGIGGEGPSVAEDLARIARWCRLESPTVSIIIVNAGNCGHVLRCLETLWRNTQSVVYEVVVVDISGHEEDLALLRNCGAGVRLFETGINRHFGEAANLGAERATGRYLCFLSPNIRVSLDWLTSLLAALDEAPPARAIAPLILAQDGTIAEAGGFMSAELGPRPRLSGKNVEVAGTETRPVDYASSDCLLMTRHSFVQVGGFDFAYEPGLYEDVDLCLKLRAGGGQTLICPGTTVVRLSESVVGPEQSSMALGDINREKLLARWGVSGDNTHRWKANRPVVAGAGRKILHQTTAAVFTPYELTPGGGERYILTMAAALTAGFAVTIVTEQPYSRLRLLRLGREFGVDLSVCRLQIRRDFLASSPPDLLVVMGNHVRPPIEAHGRRCLYHCQFPFPESSGREQGREADIGRLRPHHRQL